MRSNTRDKETSWKTAGIVTNNKLRQCQLGWTQYIEASLRRKTFQDAARKVLEIISRFLTGVGGWMNMSFHWDREYLRERRFGQEMVNSVIDMLNWSCYRTANLRQQIAGYRELKLRFTDVGLMQRKWLRFIPWPLLLLGALTVL